MKKAIAINGVSALSQRHRDWLESRQIEPEVAAAMGVYTGRRQPTGDADPETGKRPSEVVPDLEGGILCCPTIEGGMIVAEKYREAGKKFSQMPGPKQTFYNVADLEHPDVLSGAKPLVIVEGEPDCWTIKGMGFPCVSVPNGANLPGVDEDGKEIVVPQDAGDLDPATDTAFKFIGSTWDKLARVKRIVVFTDDDAPGRRLAAELVRRLGRPRCSFVQWPALTCEDKKSGGRRTVKDANEVLIAGGHEALVPMIERAKPYPISGVYKLSDFPEEPPVDFVSLGFGRDVDKFVKFYTGSLVVLTGLAGSGKTAFVMQTAAQIALNRPDWKIAIFSREMRLGQMVDILGSTATGVAPSAWVREERQMVRDFVEEQFCFVNPDDNLDEEADVPWLLDKATAAVIRHGVNCFIIDPWNEIEHRKDKNESTTEYANRAIRDLKKWARSMGVCVILVGHPTKSGADKAAEDITAYDIADSAAFQNKADVVLVVARLGSMIDDNITGLFVKKIKMQPQGGSLGAVELLFDRHLRTFTVAGVHSKPAPTKKKWRQYREME